MTAAGCWQCVVLALCGQMSATHRTGSPSVLAAEDSQCLGMLLWPGETKSSISTGDCLLAQEWGLLWEGPCVCFPTAWLVSLLFLQSFVQSSPQLQCHSGGEVPVGDEGRAGSSPALFLPKGTGGHAALTLPVSASTALFLPSGLCLARAGQTAVEQLHERRGEYVEGTRPPRAPTEPRSC